MCLAADGKRPPVTSVLDELYRPDITRSQCRRCDRLWAWLALGAAPGMDSGSGCQQQQPKHHVTGLNENPLESALEVIAAAPKENAQAQGAQEVLPVKEAPTHVPPKE